LKSEGTLPRYRTADQNWVREQNLAVVLNYVWEAREPVSRAQLATRSGLNKSTVSSLVEQLIAWGFLGELGLAGPAVGRPGRLLNINPDAGLILGVEIGVGFVAVALADFCARPLWSTRVDVLSSSGPDQVLAQVIDLSRVALRDHGGAGRRLLGVGLGAPGLVDVRQGALILAPNLGWNEVPLRAPLEAAFGCCVEVENEANAAVLGEQALGAAENARQVVFLSAGVGMGGGILIDGRLYRGRDGLAGELGHMTIDPQGEMCNCGNRGCWETLVGPRAILKRIRERAAEEKTRAIGSSSPEPPDMNGIIAAAQLGNPMVLEVLGEIGESLGIGIANLINIFNPEMVILGGALSRVAPYLLPRVRQTISERALAAAQAHVSLSASTFGPDACVMGAVTLIIRRILANPLAWSSAESCTPLPTTVQ
jgi:glucokinase-like ROK family protein